MGVGPLEILVVVYILALFLVPGAVAGRFGGRRGWGVLLLPAAWYAFVGYSQDGRLDGFDGLRVLVVMGITAVGVGLGLLLRRRRRRAAALG